MKRQIKVGLASAGILAVMGTIFVGNARITVAEEAAECMLETRDVKACRQPPKNGGLWLAVSLFAVAGFVIASIAFDVGLQDERARTLQLARRSEGKPP